MLLFVAPASRDFSAPAVYQCCQWDLPEPINLSSRFSFLFVASRQQFHLFFSGSPSIFHLLCLMASYLSLFLSTHICWVSPKHWVLRSPHCALSRTKATLYSCTTPSPHLDLGDIIQHFYFLYSDKIFWAQRNHVTSPLFLTSCYWKWSGMCTHLDTVSLGAPAFGTMSGRYWLLRGWQSHEWTWPVFLMTVSIPRLSASGLCES